MAITARQRCHYSKMNQQQEARKDAIRALVNLSQFPDESEAAIRSLRLLDASPVEIETGARVLGTTFPAESRHLRPRARLSEPDVV